MAKRGGISTNLIIWGGVAIVAVIFGPMILKTVTSTLTSGLQQYGGAKKAGGMKAKRPKGMKSARFAYDTDDLDAFDTGVLPFLPGVDTPSDPVPADKVDCAIEPNHSDCQPVSNPGIGEFKWPSPQKSTGSELADRALENLDSGQPEIQELNKGKGEWTSTFYARQLWVSNGD